jgi:hypothetical protein
VPAAGIGILSPTDSAQVIDSIKREKRQKQRIRLIEVHGGYTEGASAYGSRTSLPEANATCSARAKREVVRRPRTIIHTRQKSLASYASDHPEIIKRNATVSERPAPDRFHPVFCLAQIQRGES